MGTLWNRSGTIERFGADDLKAIGAKAYFFNGGTTTPMSVYEDSGESASHTHPLEADANGRWPDVFIPYVVGYDVRVTTAEGVQLSFTQNIPNPDPVEVSVTIPAESQVQTGMIHAELVNTTKAGYVRLNGGTIGNASSSGSERAHSDTSALFTYLWNNLPDNIAGVSGGRGASAAIDYGLNKNIVLPDMRGRAFIGLDDMGAGAGSFFSGLTFGVGNATTAGSTTGANAPVLTSGQMPAHTHNGTTDAEAAHTHSGTTGVDSVDHTHTINLSTDVQGAHIHATTESAHSHGDGELRSLQTSSGIGPFNYQLGTGQGGTARSTDAASTGLSIQSNGAHLHTVAGTTSAESVGHTHNITTGAGTSHSHTFNTSSVGGTDAFNNIPQARLITWYIKL